MRDDVQSTVQKKPLPRSAATNCYTVYEPKIEHPPVISMRALGVICVVAFSSMYFLIRPAFALVAMIGNWLGGF